MLLVKTIIGHNFLWFCVTAKFGIRLALASAPAKTISGEMAWVDKSIVRFKRIVDRFWLKTVSSAGSFFRNENCAYSTHQLQYWRDRFQIRDRRTGHERSNPESAKWGATLPFFFPVWIQELKTNMQNRWRHFLSFSRKCRETSYF